MPSIVVFGMPSEHKRDLPKLTGEIISAVSDVLKIHKSLVSVFFVPDLMDAGLGEELIVEIGGLYKVDANGLERDEKLQYTLRKMVSGALETFAAEKLPDCRIEVRIGKMYDREEVDVISTPTHP